MCRPVPKRVLPFGISKTTVLPCDPLCHAVPCGWFAIWFASFLHQPVSEIALDGRVGHPLLLRAAGRLLHGQAVKNELTRHARARPAVALGGHFG